MKLSAHTLTSADDGKSDACRSFVRGKDSRLSNLITDHPPPPARRSAASHALLLRVGRDLPLPRNAPRNWQIGRSEFFSVTTETHKEKAGWDIS